jgi:hypothetical protein
MPTDSSQVPDNPYVAFSERFRGDRPGFVRLVLQAEPEAWQEDILGAMDRGERRISVASGHGVGKTTVAAWAAVHALCSFGAAKVIVTAPSGPQLWDALYAEVCMWANRLPEGLRGLFKIGVDRIESVAAPEQLFVSARTSRAETPEALQGCHSDSGIVILVADEASGIPEAVYEAGAGSMSGHNCVTLLCSNPTRTSGLFYETHHRLKSTWYTKHVSCLDSKRVSPKFIQEMAETYGEDSNAYRVRVLGCFPLRDDDSLISLETVQAAMVRNIAIDTSARKVWGLDCARFGPDRSVLTKRWGKVVPEKPKCWRGLDTMQLVGAVKYEWDQEKESERPEDINVDVIGLGAGVVDRLRELGLPARGINVAESPAFDPNGSYYRLRDELWGKGKAWLDALDCKLPEDEGLYELAVPKYTFQSNGKMKVEGKDDMKKRLRYSPDYADSFLLTFATDAAVGGGSYKTVSWGKPIKRNLKGIV